MAAPGCFCLGPFFNVLTHVHIFHRKVDSAHVCDLVSDRIAVESVRLPKVIDLVGGLERMQNVGNVEEAEIGTRLTGLRICGSPEPD